MKKKLVERWHELLDIKSVRDFTAHELTEFARLRKAVLRSDEEEKRRCRKSLDAIFLQHAKVLASMMNKLTDNLTRLAQKMKEDLGEDEE